LCVGALSDATGSFAAPLYLMTGVCLVMALLLARLWRLERA
jgi:cyanate permease